jgi:hypothetical protein
VAERVTGPGAGSNLAQGPLSAKQATHSRPLSADDETSLLDANNYI